MRVLWVVNIVLPGVAQTFGCEPVPFGGWIASMLDELRGMEGLELGVAMRAPVAAFAAARVDGVTYYALPQKRRDQYDVAQEDCERALADFRPDLLHAEGSEMAYTLRFLRTWQGEKLLSLQGVINGYEPYETGRLPLGRMLRSGPRDALTAVSIALNKALRFGPRLRKERETISLARNVSGRTLWDRAQAYALNPGAAYYHCSRVLRPEFYASRPWRHEAAQPRALFCGNAASPRKGAHFLIAAVAQLRHEYPDVSLEIAGQRPGQRGIKGAVGYESYLLRLIERLGLRDRVRFLGPLSAGEMAEAMLRARVCVVPSVIENSPNTLAEAMMLGVPAVAAYAGGVPSMAADGEEALLHPADDPRHLAFQVKRLFDDDALCDRLSLAARARARVTHDPARNAALLLEAYRSILRAGDTEVRS